MKSRRGHSLGSEKAILYRRAARERVTRARLGGPVGDWDGRPAGLRRPVGGRDGRPAMEK